MPEAVYKVNIWFDKLTDLIQNPKHHLEKIPLRKGMVVVDYGCGSGRYTLPVAELVGPKGKVFAVDIQPSAISTIKEKAGHESLTNIEAVLVDSYDTGIQGSSTDLVLFIDTLHLIGDHRALFREIHRLLKQDGILYMDPGHLKISEAREIVESTGLFTIVECRDHNMLVTPRDKR